ncbi:MAG: hypothetical protein KAU21_02580, partial [Gammaproteobacteria bacterium]|nr:hypothetical protein [Gammaproteobacteria bacterium]
MSEYRDESWTDPVNKSDHISLTGQPATAIGGILSYSVAMGNNGEAVIAWSQDIPPASCGDLTDRQVFVSEYREGGWSHPADFNEHLINLDIMTYLPKSMMDNSGNILLGWSSYTDLFFSEYRCPDCTQVLPAIIAPRNLAAIAGDQQVNLSWQEVSNAHSYNIYWSTTGIATTSDNQITGVTGGTYLHTALTNKTIYSYLVTAVFSSTESLPSGEASARTSACAGCEPILERTILVGTPAMDEGNAIALDVDGNVYVGGQTAGELQGTHNGSYDAFIAKYNSTGILQWTVQQGTSGLESVHDIAVDADGNSYTTGYGILLSRYNSSGDLQWFIPSDFTEATGYGIALDPAGNVY